MKEVWHKRTQWIIKSSTLKWSVEWKNTYISLGPQLAIRTGGSNFWRRPLSLSSLFTLPSQIIYMDMDACMFLQPDPLQACSVDPIQCHCWASTVTNGLDWLVDALASHLDMDGVPDHYWWWKIVIAGPHGVSTCTQCLVRYNTPFPSPRTEFWC